MLAAALAGFALQGAAQPAGEARGPAQRAGKPWRVLVLAPKAVADVVIARLAGSGYVENQNIVYDRVLPGPEATAQLAALAQRSESFDAALTVLNPSVRAVRQAFPQVPVVGWTHDALRSGLVAAMARPGGMVTGLDSRAPEYVSKRLELVKLLMPQARRLAVVYGPVDDSSGFHLEALRESAPGRGLVLVPMAIRSRADADSLLPLTEPKPADAVLVVTDFGTAGNLQVIIARARERQLLSLCEFRSFVTVWGCTASYGATFGEFGDVAARQLDRLFRGTPVGELPMEYASRFELVLHAGHLKALGLTVPRELRVRADEVIE